MKPKYEKPIVVPLGEAAKGSGQCSVGSGVAIAGSGPSVICSTGYGTGPDSACNEEALRLWDAKSGAWSQSLLKSTV
jgi:hypothetical protein